MFTRLDTIYVLCKIGVSFFCTWLNERIVCSHLRCCIGAPILSVSSNSVIKSWIKRKYSFLSIIH